MIKSMVKTGEIWKVAFESGNCETYERRKGGGYEEVVWFHRILQELLEDHEDLEAGRNADLENPEVSASPDTEKGICKILVRAKIGDADVEITVPLSPVEAVSLADQIGVVNAHLKTLNVPGN